MCKKWIVLFIEFGILLICITSTKSIEYQISPRSTCSFAQTGNDNAITIGGSLSICIICATGFSLEGIFFSSSRTTKTDICLGGGVTYPRSKCLPKYLHFESYCYNCWLFSTCTGNKDSSF